MTWNQGATTHIGNIFNFAVDWVVGDSDGELFYFNYIAIFLP